jgi:hypothetical protein
MRPMRVAATLLSRDDFCSLVRRSLGYPGSRCRLSTSSLRPAMPIGRRQDGAMEPRAGKEPSFRGSTCALATRPAHVYADINPRVWISAKP